PTAIVSWHWDFKDGQASNLQDPSHFYTNSGKYPVTLDVVTLQGCASQDVDTIRVGDYQIVDFGWSSIFTGDSNKFADKTTYGNCTVLSYACNFGDVAPGPPGIGAIPPTYDGGLTSITYDKPSHKYLLNGTYTVNLVVTTTDSCSNSITKK